MHPRGRAAHLFGSAASGPLAGRVAVTGHRVAIMSEPDGKTESVGTVVVAGAANLAIAVAKLVAGLISGSAAMLSEAAHSVADTTNEVLLYQALRRGARPADTRHPFGYGRESYVWAFFAALFTFVVGAGFAITHGVTTILVHRAQRRLPDLVHRAGGLLRHRVGLAGPGRAAGPRRVPALADHARGGSCG